MLKTKRRKKQRRSSRFVKFYNKSRSHTFREKKLFNPRKFIILRSGVFSRNPSNAFYYRKLFKVKSLFRSPSKLTFFKRLRFRKLRSRRRRFGKRRVLRNRTTSPKTKGRRRAFDLLAYLSKKKKRHVVRKFSRRRNPGVNLSHVTLKLNSMYQTGSRLYTLKLPTDSIRQTSLKLVSRARSASFLNKTSLRPRSALKKALLSYTSIFIRFRLITLNLSTLGKKFLIKKQLFSFLKPNEAKRNIMNRRKKINISRFYKKLSKSDYLNFDARSRHSYAKLTKSAFFNSSQKLTAARRSYTGRTSSELFLPRVKFKPGYQRI